MTLSPVSRGRGAFAPGGGAGPAERLGLAAMGVGPQGELWCPCCPPGELWRRLLHVCHTGGRVPLSRSYRALGPSPEFLCPPSVTKV